MDIQTALDILELNPDATIDDVKRNHRKFVADWHPDRHTNNKIRMAYADGITKDVNVARDILIKHLSQPTNLKQAQPVNEPNVDTTSHISAFMEEVCSFDPFRSTNSDDLYFVYQKWCLEKNLEPLSFLQVVSSLEGLGFIPIRKEDKPYFQSVYWNGFKLNQEWEEKIIQIKEAMEFTSESEEPGRKQQEFSDMDDDDDLSEVVF
jgi:hypothetical protein